MTHMIIKIIMVAFMTLILATPIICFAANNKTNNKTNNGNVINTVEEAVVEKQKEELVRVEFKSTISEDLESARKEQEELDRLEKEKALAEEKTIKEKEQSVKVPQKVSLGTYKLTAYCPCAQCCGKTDGITSSGTKATQGRTIAVDTRVIPYGTKVIINGNTYIAEDTGGAIKGNRIDIYFNGHQEALNFGVQYKEVFVYK